MTSGELEPAYEVVLVLEEPRPTFAVEELRDRINLTVFSIAALIATAGWFWFLLKIADILLGH
jgi:hypothetical protein